MRLMQLIYASQPFGFDTAALNGILASARRNNQRDGITGALICRADLYLQMLEGPRGKVTAAFRRILDDDRHVGVTWHMRDDPARSWMWNQAQVAAGAVDAATMDEVRAVFDRLAREPDDVG
jgi:Sensors of blue-light using FAD